MAGRGEFSSVVFFSTASAAEAAGVADSDIIFVLKFFPFKFEFEKNQNFSKLIKKIMQFLSLTVLDSIYLKIESFL